MPEEPKTSISAKIPTSLHNKLIEAVQLKKFDDKTDCITQGLEIILCNTNQSPSFLENVIREKDAEIQRLTLDILNISRKTPEIQEPAELIELRAQLSVIRELLSEKDRSIERLEREVSRLDMFAHYLKAHEVQSQSVIPSNTQTGGLLKKVCKNCGNTFFAKNYRQEYCEEKCRWKFYKNKKKLVN